MRDWHLFKALNSTRSLAEVLGELTEEEIMHALDVEVRSRRRQVIVDRLISKAADLKRKAILTELKARFSIST